MVMATLFAESETFMLANRPETKVKIHSQVKPPRWAMFHYENARVQREERRERDEKVTRAQEMAQRIGPPGAH
jgi:hypothetical protein